MKVLIVKLSSLGDVVHAVAFVNRLKQARPGARVDWLVNDVYAPLVKYVRGVEEVWAFRRAAWGREWYAPRTWGEIAGLVAWLRRKRYDVCLDLQGLLRSGLVTALSGADITAGFANAREGSRHLYGARLDPGPKPHAVDVLFSALKLFAVDPPERPDFSFVIPEKASAHASALLEGLGVRKRYLVFHTGARWKTKMWPAAHWRRLAGEVVRKTGMPVVFTGVAGDAAEINSIIGDRRGLYSVAGGLGLLESAAVLAGASLVVTVDSGPMHIAAAFDRPIIALFGPTSPEKTGPRGGGPQEVVRVAAPCAPCFSRGCRRKLECMEGITPDEVEYRVLRMLGFAGLL